MLALLLACVDRDPEEGTREAWRWPFTAESPWNMPAGAGLALEATGAACTRAVQDDRVDAWVNAETWSHPVYHAVEGDPLARLWEDGVLRGEVHMPRGATPSLPAWPDGDAHLHVFDPGSRMVTELWRARPRGDGDWDVDSVATVDLRGSGVGTDGVRIHGGSAIAGLWRDGEAAAGARHALALSLPLAALAPTFVWPATELSTSREASMLGPVPVGQHVALPRNWDVDALTTPEGRALAVTLRDWGAYVVDHARGFALYAEPAAAAEADRMREDIDTIRAALRCTTNNTADTPGGPGERVAPLAPDFAAD